MVFWNDAGTLKLTVAPCQCGKLQIGSLTLTIHHPDLKDLAKIFHRFSEAYVNKEHCIGNQSSYKKNHEKSESRMLLVE